MDAVSTASLTKVFGDITAVNHVDLSVPEGSIFGLLGPNGAGKSTTVRLLATLLRPTEGTAKVAGHDILEEPVEIRKVVGVLPEEGNHTHYQKMTVYENLKYFARLYDVPDDEIPMRIEELLKFMELWERRNDPAGELSSGNRQRLALCRAMLHNPKILLLDEPTATLDPVAAKRVRELILSLAERYKQTFFINSHNLAEVQRICDRIAIIDEGKILLMGKVDDLRKRLQAKQIFRLRVSGDIQAAAQVAEKVPFVNETRIEADTVLLEINDPVKNNPKLLRELLDAGVGVIELVEEEMTLEDVYLATIKEAEQ